MLGLCVFKVWSWCTLALPLVALSGSKTIDDEGFTEILSDDVRAEETKIANYL